MMDLSRCNLPTDLVIASRAAGVSSIETSFLSKGGGQMIVMKITTYTIKMLKSNVCKSGPVEGLKWGINYPKTGRQSWTWLQIRALDGPALTAIANTEILRN